MLTYNHKNVHSSITMTPYEATKPSNAVDATYTIELQAQFTKKYPELEIGSKVKIYKKTTLGQQERASSFSQSAFTLNNVEELHGQKYFKVEGNDRAIVKS